MNFFEELHQQRWDDHRYYHHNRVNQTLHLMSACCFLASYVLIFIEPVYAVMVGWLLAMILRQIGHFFFEPKTYDDVNDASHEYKESVKVGYNLKRKVILLTVWIISPVTLYFSPDFYGLLHSPQSGYAFLHNLSILWIFIGGGALVFRTLHLFLIMNIQSGLVWFTKIMTDPFHDIKIYHKAPLYLLRGELYDDMTDWYNPVVYPEKIS